jgi:hypothetical protein
MGSRVLDSRYPKVQNQEGRWIERRFIAVDLKGDIISEFLGLRRLGHRKPYIRTRKITKSETPKRRKTRYRSITWSEISSYHHFGFQQVEESRRSTLGIVKPQNPKSFVAYTKGLVNPRHGCSEDPEWISAEGRGICVSISKNYHFFDVGNTSPSHNSISSLVILSTYPQHNDHTPKEILIFISLCTYPRHFVMVQLKEIILLVEIGVIFLSKGHSIYFSSILGPTTNNFSELMAQKLLLISVKEKMNLT